ncbi:hypothetical protein ACJW30_01G236400 [Castanea mollissima]
MQRDTCFHCRQQGHWARDCPLKKSQPSTSFSNGLDLPLFRCPCGLGFCLALVSHTDKNPGRKFFTCPGIEGNNCGFFKWCDEVTTGETSKSPPEGVYPYPKCSCEAGVCKRIMLNRSPNAGRTCFVCRVPRGFGACYFLQWEDTQEITTVNDIADESNHEICAKTTLRKHPLDSDLGDSSIENPKRMKFDSLEMESPQHFPTVAHAREFDGPSSQISGQGAQALCDVSLEMPIAKSPPAMLEGRITTLNMDVLEQTVLDVQNKLLAHLVSMAQEAESTFNVLDILLVNHAPFHELVKKFIVCASSLADKEKSVNQEQSLQALIERYHSEKVRYDDISHIHAETETALTASNRRLKSLREEASCVKDLLLRIENQLSSCEAETKELEDRSGEISRNMLESQKSLQAAYEEAEEALKLHQLKFCQQREQMQNAIMAGLELVRSKLRK